MGERDEIRKSLEDALLNATNNDERVKLANALNQYNSTIYEREKNEAKNRLDREIHEDDLRKTRDEAIISERHYLWEMIKDIVNILFKLFGGIGTLMLIAKAMKDDKDGEPWYGTMKDVASALFRKWF